MPLTQALAGLGILVRREEIGISFREANMTACSENRAYLSSERERLRAALEENKWYLSQRAGHDVGATIAEWDFIDHHLEAFADRFRAAFCGRCSHSDECVVCERFVMRAALARV